VFLLKLNVVFSSLILKILSEVSGNSYLKATPSSDKLKNDI